MMNSIYPLPDDEIIKIKMSLMMSGKFGDNEIETLKSLSDHRLLKSLYDKYILRDKPRKRLQNNPKNVKIR